MYVVCVCVCVFACMSDIKSQKWGVSCAKKLTCSNATS